MDVITKSGMRQPKDQCIDPVAILGMACTFANAQDLTQFWRHCVNETKQHGPAPETVARGKTLDVLTKVITQAAQDAGILTDSLIMPNVRILLSAADGKGEEKRAGLAAFLGVDPVHILLHNFPEFHEISFLEAALMISRKQDVDFVVAAAMNEVPVMECAAVVLCSEFARASGKKAYAIVESLTVLAEECLADEINALPGKGVGHLVFLSGLDSSTVESVHATQDAIPAEGRKPKAFCPGCILSCPGAGQTPVSDLKAMIQAAMALAAKVVVPCAGSFPREDWKKITGFTLNMETRPWFHDESRGPRRAAARIPFGEKNNILTVLAEVPAGLPSGIVSMPVVSGLSADSELVVMAADTALNLSKTVQALRERLNAGSWRLDEVACFFSTQFDARKPHRLALVSKSPRELMRLLEISHIRLQAPMPDFESEEAIYYTPNASEQSGRVACLFPGLGFPGLLGPYADHLMSLALHFPEFRKVFDSVESRDCRADDPVPTSLIFFPPAAWPETVRSEMRKRLASPRIEDGFENKDPACRNLSSFGVSVANWACWRLLRELGIQPDFLFGQSLGELSALCASGVIAFSDFIPICWQVSIDADEHIKNGRLALVGAGVQSLAPLLADFSDVYVAIHVGPEFQILGGDFLSLKNLIDRLRQEGVWTHFLPYPAIHTPNLTALRPLMAPHLMNLQVKPPAIPVYSGMTADVYPGDVESIREIMIANLDHPVFLWQTTQKIYENGARIFVQAGGGATMYAQARTNINSSELTTLSLDVDYRSAVNQLHHLCAALLVKGVPVRIPYLYEHRGLDVRDTASFLSCLDSDSVNFSGQTEARMPFIGKVLKYEENLEIRVERVIDLNQDLFMRDHLFVNAQSVKPESACLPVVPMTISLEMMAEAAACLAPGCGLIGFEDVRASQWIAFLDCETLTVQIYARCNDAEPLDGIHRIAAAVFTPDSAKPAIQGTVILAKHYVEELFPEFTPIDAPYCYPFKEEAVYGERHLFHGPVFHCITGQTAFAGKKVIGTLRVMPRHGMFSFLGVPEFLCDPVLLDGVGQLAGLWAMSQGKHVFPIGVKKIEIYCPTPETGSDLPILLEIKEYGPKMLAADVEIQDGKGRVWMRIHHWQDWVFHWPKGIYDFRRNPEQGIPSRALTGKHIPADAVVQYVSKQDLKDVWLDVAARFFLHPDEMKFLAQIEMMETRWQWLMGRIALKDALRRWLAGPSNPMLHPAGMLIQETGDGTPVLKNADHFGRRPFIWLESSDVGAVAAVSGVPFDIDVNKILDQIEIPHANNKKEPVIWRLSN